MKPLVLCILDGVGIREETKGNAVYMANMPNFKRLLNEYPSSLLEASGSLVGLPEGQMGNSEVGHTNIGAGRIVFQPLQLINHKIENKEFFENEKILNIINYTKQKKSKLHIMGLLSDGGIHSHISHLFALLDMCKQEKVEEVYLHLFLDGRDTLPNEGLKYLDLLDSKINEIKLGKICSVSGRYYAMDRDNNYDRLEKAYNAIVYGEGETFDNYKEAIEFSQKQNITDEFTIPAVIEKQPIENNDGIIVFNFRPDRLREIGYSLTNPNFNEFQHKKLKDIKLLTMMPVSSDVICENAFELPKLDNTLGEYISKQGLSQLRIAETEKYAHVTYFFDGGVEKKLKGAKRTLIASPKVATYDLSPIMSAKKITLALLKQLNKFDVVILNFANGDMVGHTGNLKASIKALEAVDECLGRIINKVNELDGTLIVTADHGNCEEMLDDDNNVLTSHTTNKVPFIVTRNDIKLKDGKLADIAPTMLSLLNLPIPSEMTGQILIEENNPKKSKDNFGKAFRILSIIFLLFFIGIYFYRFIHYYNASHTKKAYKETNIVAKLDSNKLVDSGSGLYIKDNVKYFKGNVNNNYLYYKGLTWRIISYNSDEIKLVSEESLTILPYSEVEEWLFNFKINFKDDQYVKNLDLITSEEYNNSFDKISYMNNRTYWYTKDNKYIDKDGKLIDKVDSIYSVRVSLTIGTDAIIISGDGTLGDSYKITKEKPTILKDADIGNYVKFSDKLWRIIGFNEYGIKVASEELLEERIYSKKYESFNTKDTNSLAYYLNNEYYNSLDTSKISDAVWNITRYNTKYEIIETIKANVGLLNMGDLFINELNNYTLMSDKDKYTIYKVNPYGLLYVDSKSSARKVRTSLYLNEELEITEGTGYKNSPYVIGG